MSFFRVSMTTSSISFLILFLWVLSTPLPLQGDDHDESDLIRVLLEDPALSDETREALTRLLEDSGSPDGADGWADRLSVFGDFRLRHESTVERDDQRDRHRERIRLRLGATYDIGDDLTLGTRLITGDPDDPNSPHVTLGDGFNSFEVSLDRAYLHYTPEQVEGLAVTAGKFGHPFTTNPVYGELVWDGDIQPEGIVARYRTGSESYVYELIAGQYLLVEQNNAADAALSAFQGVVRRDGESCDARLAVGYYLYANTTPDGDTTLLADDQGNQLIDTDGDTIPDEFLSDFGVLDAIAAVDLSVADRPVTFSGQYIRNTKTGDRSQGWALGASLGKTREPGDWSTYYQWQVVEQEATFSPFVQDDFVLGTNHRSHVFGAKYRCTAGIVAHLWALVSRRDHTSPGATTDSDKDQWRIRIDVNIKF